MNLLKLILFFCSLIILLSCGKSDEEILLLEKIEKKNIESFDKINKAWMLNVPQGSVEVKSVLDNWKDWQSFEQELKQKPQYSISAFKQKVKNLVSKSDSLHLNLPYQINIPQVRSRIVALQTKILSLDTYFYLDIVPHDKIQNIIISINKEINAFYIQCEEIQIKKRIPLENGEEKLISIKDTTRNAKTIDFDKMEELEILNKEK